METGLAAPESGNGEGHAAPGEHPQLLNLEGLLNLYRQPSGEEQLHSLLYLRSMSRSLSLTLPWEVSRLSGSLQPQRSLVNQGLCPAGPAAAARLAERAAPSPGALLSASWHDIQQLRLEACLNAREQELDAAAADQLSEEARLATLIETKKLRLVGLQRELRQEVLLEQRLVEGCSLTQLLDWSRWRRPPPGRLAGFVPPKLPAVEVQRRLLRDPETARRARQQALQQWAAQHAGPAQQAVQRTGSLSLSQQLPLRADSLAIHLQQDAQKARPSPGGGAQAEGGAAGTAHPRKRMRRSANPQQGDAGVAGGEAGTPPADGGAAVAVRAAEAEGQAQAAPEQQRQQQRRERRVRWEGGRCESEGPAGHEEEEAPGSAAEARQQQQQAASLKCGLAEAEGCGVPLEDEEGRARSGCGSPRSEAAAGGDGGESDEEGWDVPVLAMGSVPSGTGDASMFLEQ